MAQRTPSTSLAGQAFRKERPGRISLQSRHSSTVSSVSSQESDSPSRFGTPQGTPTTPATTPATRLPTPIFESGEDRAHKAFPGYILFYNIGRSISSSDDEAGPSRDRRTPNHKGKEPEVYEDSEDFASIATRLSRMEHKLDELLSREREPHHEETLETTTDEQIQSSQIYRDLEAQNASLEGDLETVRMELADSKQAQSQTQSLFQDLEAAKERSENEASECMAQSMNEYETLKAEYQWVKENWNRTSEEREEAWDKAKEYERENETLKQKISDLEDANERLAGKIRARDLEDIRGKESQSDGKSQTEPEVDTEVEPNSMEFHGADTTFIARDDIELHEQGELETEIQGGEQVRQDGQQENQQQQQHEVPQDESEVQNEEPLEGQQQDTQQEVTPERPQGEPHIQQAGEQEEPQKEVCDSQDEDRQDGTTNNSQVDPKEIEDDISHNEMLARGERQLERLMSITQEPVVGGHTEPDNIEQQEMVETSVGNDQPMFEAPAEHSPLEIQEVPLVGITRQPTTAEPGVIPEPVHVTSAEPPRNRDRHSQEKHRRRRHRRKEAGDHHRDRDHHQDREHHHRPSNRSDRPRNPEQQIMRRQREMRATQWIWSRSWMKRHFGVRLRRLIPMLDIRLW